MARARNIKPGFFTDAELVECEFWERLLFAGLWTIADKSGRLFDRPKQIKLDLFPADDVDIRSGLDSLERHGLIRRYSTSDQAIVQITNFAKHQNPHKDERASTIPAEFAPEEHGASTVQAPESHGANRADSLVLIPDSGLIELIPPKSPFEGESVSSVSGETNESSPEKKMRSGKTREKDNPYWHDLRRWYLFDEYWQAHPRKVAKEDAMRAWRQVLGEHDNDEATMQAFHMLFERTAVEWNRRPADKVPHFATWINRRDWEDAIRPLRILSA